MFKCVCEYFPQLQSGEGCHHLSWAETFQQGLPPGLHPQPFLLNPKRRGLGKDGPCKDWVDNDHAVDHRLCHAPDLGVLSSLDSREPSVLVGGSRNTRHELWEGWSCSLQEDKEVDRGRAPDLGAGGGERG